MATRKRSKKAKQRTAEALPARPFPAHLSSSPEEWRALKRTEWREVTQALDRFYHGSAYVPGQSPLYKIGLLARQISEAIEAPDWIAW